MFFLHSSLSMNHFKLEACTRLLGVWANKLESLTQVLKIEASKETQQGACRNFSWENINE